MNEVEQQPDYQVNVDDLPLTNRLQRVHQEGNFVVGVSETGVRFRQRIPQGKMLVQEDGKFKFVDVDIKGVSVG